MKKVLAPIFWLLLALAGAAAYATLAFRRSEPVNSGYILIAAVLHLRHWLPVLFQMDCRARAGAQRAPRHHPARSTTTARIL